MKKVGIVYHSGMGNTHRLAEAVAKGASGQPRVEAALLPVETASIVEGRFSDESFMAQIDSCDAIMFGAPTYMGMVSGPFKCFADATAPFWFDQRWKDKIAGGFTTSGYASGDKVMTLHYLATLAAQLRMIWVGPATPPSNVTQDGRELDRWGYYLGLGAIGSAFEAGYPDAGDLATAELYGRRVAEVASKWYQEVPA